MREIALRKDNKPRFFQLESGNHLIIDQEGYHEYCAICKRVVFEYLLIGGVMERSCQCATVETNELITQLWRAIDQCHTVEDVKRMLMMFVSAKEMSA